MQIAAAHEVFLLRALSLKESLHNIHTYSTLSEPDPHSPR